MSRKTLERQKYDDLSLAAWHVVKSLVKRDQLKAPIAIHGP
jgi:hypothetical protein